LEKGTAWVREKGRKGGRRKGRKKMKVIRDLLDVVPLFGRKGEEKEES